MKKELITRGARSTMILGSLLPLLCGGAQFVELKTEIEAQDWDYWFFCDRIGKYPGQGDVPSIFTEIQTRRCVVGSKIWMIESDLPTFRVTYWFTGTNVIEHTMITKETPDEVVK